MPIVVKIKEYCAKKNLSVREFEIKCGLYNGSVGKWERGEAFPTVISLIKMERGTGVKLSSWLKGYQDWEI